MRGAPPDLRSPDQLEELIAEHQVAVWRYLRFLGAETHRAEDLLQETFLAAWEKPFEQRSPAATRRYLFVVARNRFLMARRRGRVRMHFRTVDEADLAWERYAADGGQAYLESLRECMDGLSERNREAVRLQYFESRSRAEIGRVLGISVEGVKTMLRRVRVDLRECVEARMNG